MPEAAAAAAPVVVPSKPTPAPEAKPAEVKPPEPAKPAEAKPEPAKSDKPMGARYADLARREKGLALSRSELKAQQEALAAEKAELKAWKEAREAAKRDPAKHLASTYGENWYEALTHLKVEGKPPADIALAAVDERLESFKAEQRAAQEAQAKAQKEQAAASERAARAQFEGGAKSFLEANAENYKLTIRKGYQAQVTGLIEANYKKTGQMLSYKDAADRVEEFHRAEAKRDAEELGLAPRAEPVVAKTLTNGMNGSAAGSAAPAAAGDNFARALALFKERQRR